MERGFDAGVAVVPDVNGNANGYNVDVNVNARAGGERSPAVVPIGQGEPSVAGVGTDEREESGDFQLLAYFCV